MGPSLGKIGLWGGLDYTNGIHKDSYDLFEDGRPTTLSSSETGFSMILLFSLKGGEIAVLVQSNTEQCKAMLSNIKYQRIECYL